MAKGRLPQASVDNYLLESHPDTLNIRTNKDGAYSNVRAKIHLIAIVFSRESLRRIKFAVDVDEVEGTVTRVFFAVLQHQEPTRSLLIAQGSVWNVKSGVAAGAD